MKAILPFFVYWEEDDTRRKLVRGVCERCDRTEVLNEQKLLSITDPMLVSPSGLIHGQHEEHHERTSCGADATGLEWWWRS